MRLDINGLSKSLVRFFGDKECEHESGIFLDADADGVLLHFAFGPGIEMSGGATEAVVADVGELDRFVEIVRFSSLKRLPVDAWVCSGLAHAPYSVREVAGWLMQIEALRAPGKLIVRTTDLTENQKTRLVDELVRRGCRLHESCAIERA